MPYFAAYEEHRRASGIARALEQIDPQRVEMANAHRFDPDDPPPPYSLPGDTTEPPSLTSPPRGPDPVERVRAAVELRDKGTPGSMFRLLAEQQLKRLQQQIHDYPPGREHVCSFDMSLDYQANAENNIRKHWTDQGIWKDGWGAAWPRGSQPMTPLWLWGERDRSFWPPQPRGRWAHEAASDPQSVRDPEASRPFPQFMYQVSTERKWIKDRLEWEQPATAMEADLDNMAFEAVKQMWQEQGLWRSQWATLPRRSWAHEEPDEALENDPWYKKLYRPNPDAQTSDGEQSCAATGAGDNGRRTQSLFGGSAHPAPSAPDRANGVQTERTFRILNIKT